MSKLDETDIIPSSDTTPYEGRNPITPQYPAGTLTPPSVSIPVIDSYTNAGLETKRQNR